jgi:arabinogalactan oligomer/maltooligosaccharide transport system substrate-binding protein
VSARLALLLGGAVLLGAAACASEPPGGVVLWHAYTGAEREALEASAGRWNVAHPEARLALVAVPYDAFADKLTSAIPNGNGPDLFIYAGDRLGDWSGSGLVAPIGYWLDEPVAGRFGAEALRGLRVGETQFGLPLAVKSLALFYRTDLVPTPPRTTDELVAMRATMPRPDVYPLVYASGDLYGHAPWLHGFGATILDDAGQPTLAGSAGAAAARFAKALIDQRVVPADATGTTVSTLFAEGKAAMAISGPWFIGELRADIPWKVTTLPTVSATGKPAAPLLGIEGVLMSARARDRKVAYAAMAFLTSDGEAAARAVGARQVVPNRGAYDDAAVRDDAALAAFRTQAEVAVPMPSAPAMRVVWTPYQTALGDILAGNRDAESRLADAQREVLGYLRPEATP